MFPRTNSWIYGSLRHDRDLSSREMTHSARERPTLLRVNCNATIRFIQCVVCSLNVVTRVYCSETVGIQLQGHVQAVISSGCPVVIQGYGGASSRRVMPLIGRPAAPPRQGLDLLCENVLSIVNSLGNQNKDARIATIPLGDTGQVNPIARTTSRD